MYRKTGDVSKKGRDKSGLRVQFEWFTGPAPAAFGRCLNRFRGGAFCIVNSLLWAVVLSIGCTPPPPVAQICPEPLWKEYASFLPYKIREEEIKLEALLAAGDTLVQSTDSTADSTGRAAIGKLSALDIKRRLFELSIHLANADFDVDKISGYALVLARCGGPDSLWYLNWDRAAREQKSLMKERDSLETVISAITASSEAERKETRSMDGLKKEIKTYQKQRDSLTAVISSQQEMISKLQKLDVLMERQRNKIQ